MTSKDILDSLNDIDPALVEAAAPREKRKYRRWLAAAACLAVVTVACIAAAGNTAPSVSVDLGGMIREYTESSFISSETALIFPWEYQTICEQFSAMEFEGTPYRGRCRNISEPLLGDVLGSCEAVGYDTYTDREYTQTFEVRGILGVDPGCLLAVKLENAYYVFMADTYAPPVTLGEFLDRYDLPRTLPLNRFCVQEESKAVRYRCLEDSPTGADAIWDILETCRSAPFIEDVPWDARKDSLSFTVTSDALGVYKHAFYITADGKLWTNAMEWAYAYDIGKEAAEKIITYAMGHSKDAANEPYSYQLCGTVTEICDGYFLLSDAVLAKDGGITFKVPATDLRISRWLDFGGIGVGDLIVVSYTGGIGEDADHTVCAPYELSKAILSDGKVLIPE